MKDTSGLQKRHYLPKDISNFWNWSILKKILTTEPVLDFDLKVFTSWIEDIDPEYIWLEFDSRSKQVQLAEPSAEKLIALSAALQEAGIQIKGKELRGLKI